MRYRIHQIKLDIDQGHEGLPDAVRRKLGKKDLRIRDLQIIRESVDARKKPRIKRVYTLDFTCDARLPLEEAVTREYRLPEGCSQKLFPGKADGDETAGFGGEAGSRGNETVKDRGTGSPGDPSGGFRHRRPVVAGFGPCGIFAALILAEAGLRPLVIERGQPVEQRIKDVERFWAEGALNPESNVQFGEGGAGTFSDGKLTTGIKDLRIGKVFQELVAAGADPHILYKQKPHIGTDKLRIIVPRLRQKIQALGGDIRFGRKLTGLQIQEKDGARLLRAVVLEDGSQIETDALVLAIGHSARDTFQALYEAGLSMEQKPFSIGVRIQHPQELIDRAQYGDETLAEVLGPADYKLHHRCQSGRGVYTFCMCPGGQVIDASSEPETAVTNGMSGSARDGRYANSGLLVDVRTEDFLSQHPLAGVEFQRIFERMAYLQGGGSLPRTCYGSFRREQNDPVRRSLPDFAWEAILEAMPFLGRKLAGFDREDAELIGVETRSSSPVRIRRDEGGHSTVRGLFPAGEGPGYAGGIVSAAVDGIRTAEKIILAGMK